jgi:hypothetical protein
VSSSAEPELEGIETHPVEASRLLVGDQRHGLVSGPGRVVNRLVDIAARRRLEGVIGELGEMRIALGAVELLERLDRTPVKPQALATGEIAVEAVSDQRMREPKAAAANGDIDDDSRRLRLVEQVEQPLMGLLADPLERIEPELSAEDRGDRE